MFELKKIETLSKSSQIEEMIKEKITSGELKPGEQLPSEVSMAGTLGTHRLTVNKAVSNLVRDGLLYREHGRGTFVSKPTSTKKSSAAGKMISIIFAGEFSSVSNEYFFSSYQGLCSYLSEYDVVIKTEMFKNFRDCNPLPGISAAAVFSFNDVTPDDLKVFTERKIPVVLFNRYMTGKKKCPSVIADNRASAEEVTRLLIEDGHKNILYVRSNIDSSVARDRLEGCNAAFEALKPKGKLQVIRSKGWLGPDAYESISSELNGKEIKFSAVICEGIHILWGVRTFFEDKKIPGSRNLAFACLDNWGTIPVFISDLKYSVEFPLAEMGRRLGKMLIDAASGKITKPEILKIPGWIIGKNNARAQEAK